MAVYGLREFSLIDYPGKISCVVFFGNCNFRCPYCHNPVLVFDPASQGEISLGKLAEFFEKRRGKLSGAVFSGGEPTLAVDLPAYLELARFYGLATKLDTNGSHPEELERLIGLKLLDAVGIDFKAPPYKYSQVTGNPGPAVFEKVMESIRLVRRHKLDWEVRTTVHKSLLSLEDLRAMETCLRQNKVGKWVIQMFHEAELIDERLLGEETYTSGELTAFARGSRLDIMLRGAGY